MTIYRALAEGDLDAADTLSAQWLAREGRPAIALESVIDVLDQRGELSKAPGDALARIAISRKRIPPMPTLLNDSTSIATWRKGEKAAASERGASSILLHRAATTHRPRRRTRRRRSAASACRRSARTRPCDTSTSRQSGVGTRSILCAARIANTACCFAKAHRCARGPRVRRHRRVHRRGEARGGPLRRRMSRRVCPPIIQAASELEQLGRMREELELREDTLRRARRHYGDHTCRRPKPKRASARACSRSATTDRRARTTKPPKKS